MRVEPQHLVLICLALLASAFFFGFLDSLLKPPKRDEPEQGADDEF